jgi:hypothetical protein
MLTSQCTTDRPIIGSCSDDFPSRAVLRRASRRACFARRLLRPSLMARTLGSRTDKPGQRWRPHLRSAHGDRTSAFVPESQRREFGRGIVDLLSLATTMSEDNACAGYLPR